MSPPGSSPASDGMYCELMEDGYEGVNRRPDVRRFGLPVTLKPCSPGSCRFITIFLAVLCVVLLIVLIAVSVHLRSSCEAVKPTVAPVGPTTCPAEWHRLNNSCYLVINGTRNWNDSQAYCQKKGAHLAIILTSEEQTFLFDLLPEAPWKAYWLGISDSKTEGKWVWIDGTALVQGFWRDGEPNNGERENCGSIMKLQGSNTTAIHSWYDSNCDDRWPSICEIEIVAEASTATRH